MGLSSGQTWPPLLESFLPETGLTNWRAHSRRRPDTSPPEHSTKVRGAEAQTLDREISVQSKCRARVPPHELS
jgi:hypothetical protein